MEWSKNGVINGTGWRGRRNGGSESLFRWKEQCEESAQVAWKWFDELVLVQLDEFSSNQLQSSLPLPVKESFPIPIHKRHSLQFPLRFGKLGKLGNLCSNQSSLSQLLRLSQWASNRKGHLNQTRFIETPISP